MRERFAQKLGMKDPFRRRAGEARHGLHWPREKVARGLEAMPRGTK
jgi:hypothetical protein